MSRFPRILWRFLVGAAGFGVMAVGATLLVLPGPGALVLLLGLAILATEFRWARRLLDRAAKWVKRGGRFVRRMRQGHRKAGDERSS